MLLLLTLNFLLLTTAAAQLQPVHSLGRVQRNELTAITHFPTLITFHHSNIPDLLYFQKDSSALMLLKNIGDSVFADPQMIAKISMPTSLTVGKINNDGIDDIVVVHREQNQLTVLLSSAADSTYSQYSYPVNFYPEQAVIGDMTNDRIPDIISFGKLSSGIGLLQGRGNGKFQPVKIMFENIPVSEFSIIALNGDNIPDVAMHNWLTNETILYLGLGRLKFSEQTVLSFAQDTVHTLITDVNNDGMADVAVLSIQNRTVQILDGDGLGNFSFTQILPLSSNSKHISINAFQGVQSKDLMIRSSDQSVISLLLNRSDGTFYDEVIFGISNPHSEILSGDLNGDGVDDVMTIDTVKKEYTVMWNSRTIVPPPGSAQELAVGASPTNMYVNDLTMDGYDDIVVSNGLSSTLSVLVSSGNSFYGQLSVETAEHPVAVSLYAKSDTSITFYTTHQENPKISLISLRQGNDSVYSLAGDIEQFSISLPEKPVTVLPDVSFMQRGISLYAFMSTAKNAIVFYQQVRGTRFLAKSLVPIIPSKINFSTINDLNGDGKTDLFYVYADAQTKENFLGVTVNDSSGEFKGKVYSVEIPDAVINRSMIFIEDMNGDQLKDCILYTAPENIVRIALGDRETLFRNFQTLIPAVSLETPEQLQIYDYDGDGILDVLLSEPKAEHISLYRGKGNGTLANKSVVAQKKGISIFRCGDFNGDSSTDIVLLNSGSNTVTVLYGKVQ